MSFDIFLASVHAGEPMPFPRAILEEIFQPYIEPHEGTSIHVRFPDGWDAWLDCSDVVEVDGVSCVYGLVINRPPVSPEFWDGLIELMRRTPTVLLWPGDGVCSVVVNPDVIKELSPGQIESTGIPAVITTKEEISKYITES